MTNTVHFTIKYDGPALENHQMDVRELAPALIALSNMLEEANKVAFPESGSVKVHVQGNFKGGSFGVNLIAIQGITDQIVAILSGPHSSAFSNLMAILEAIGLIGGSGYGLIGLMKWLRGRKPTSIHISDNQYIFEVIESSFSETFTVDLITGKLFQNRLIRKELAQVVKPLERDGINLFASGKDGKTSEVIEKEDMPCFEFAESDVEIISDIITEHILLQIESAVFKDQNKWRFNDGTCSFFGEITDSAFIQEINNGKERFGKGDVLHVDLRRTQIISEKGLKTDYQIVCVHEHRAPLQQKFGF